MLTSDKIHTVFDRRSPSSSLSELSIRLLDQQRQTWPQLAGGYASLATVKTRDIDCDGYSVILQFNPGRIASTDANMDPKAIRERRCFLCLQNLPSPQKGILYEGEFLLLCNPAPIFAQHYTISNVKHIPQALEPFIPTFLNLARDLSPAFTVFYNGPKCGASAPDHMHFQAGPAGVIPVERDCVDDRRRVLKRTVDGIPVSLLDRYGREALIFEGRDAGAVEGVLRRAIDALRRVMQTSEEPMMNMLCTCKDSKWQIILFPRSKHRPEAYFKEEEERIVISPAAVDIGGLLITPVEKDFNSVGAEVLEGIFREVGVSRQVVEAIIEAI